MKLSETPIGNLPAQTFRPTEAEKLVLLNIDDMIAQGRSVTQQDAINVSQEKMDEDELNRDQLESAFKQLINIQLLQVEPNQTVVISQAGVPVVEELKKAEQQADQQKAEQQPAQDPSQMGGMDTGVGGVGDNAMGSSQAGGLNLPMESFSLITYLNDMSKLI